MDLQTSSKAKHHAVTQRNSGTNEKLVIEIYQTGRGHKAISKALGLQQTPVRTIIYKWGKHGTVVDLPRSSQLTKIIPGAQRQLIQGVTKDPKTTSKELQALFASVTVSVHDSTMRETGQKWFQDENHR